MRFLIKRFILPALFFFFLSGTFLHAQAILLEQEVNADTVPMTFGPNARHFLHSVMRYGFIFGNPDASGAATRPFNANEFSVALRYKRRFSNFYSLGFDVLYSVTNYHLKQDSSKRVPNPVLHKKEKIAFNNLGLELFNRFNIGKRGNILGNFMDIGGYGEYGASIRHFYRDEFAAPLAGSSVQEVTNKSLRYVNSLNYGGMIRIGSNRYALVGKYRISDVFKKSYLAPTGLPYPELPRIIVGVELGFIK